MIKSPCTIHQGIPINAIVHYCGNHKLVFLCFDQCLLWRSFDNVLWSSSGHVFTNFPNTNLRFFSTKYYVTFVLIVSDSQNCEKNVFFWPIRNLFYCSTEKYWWKNLLICIHKIRENMSWARYIIGETKENFAKIVWLCQLHSRRPFSRIFWWSR